MSGASKEDTSYAELEVLRHVMSAGAASVASVASCEKSASTGYGGSIGSGTGDGRPARPAFGFLREKRQLCAALQSPPQLTAAPAPCPFGRDRMVQFLAQDYVDSMQPSKKMFADGLFSWTVPIRKFKEKDRQLISPSFFIELDQHGGGADFKIIIRPATGGSFAQADGKGYIEVKLVGSLAGRRSLVKMRVSVGGSPFLEQQHDFHDGAVACLRDIHVPKIFDFARLTKDVQILLHISPIEEPPPAKQTFLL